MKTVKRNYKTLKGFWMAWKKAQNRDFVTFSFSDYLRGYYCVFSKNEFYHVYFNFSDSVKEELCKLFASGIASKSNRAKYTDIIADYIGADKGIFNNLWIRKNGTRFYGEYCAGQDWNSETRFVQNLLKKGSLWDCH